MSFIKKLWKDRVSEYPNRRTINDGYTTKRVTVGRDEGNISEEGTPFNAANMNDLEDRIFAAVESGGGGGGSGTYAYDDLMNKPTINSVQLAGNKTTADLHISYNDLEDTPTLATVATSGDYNDLANKPTFPTFLDITSLVTWGESKGGGTKFFYKDGAIYLTYQGEAKAHAANTLLFTLPSGYRPSANETIFPFIKNANAYGNIKITGSDGKCVVNTISDTTVSGRVYFNAVIVL